MAHRDIARYTREMQLLDPLIDALFSGIILDHVKLAGQDACQDLDDFMSQEMLASIGPVIPNGFEDVQAHHFSCFLLGGDHGYLGIYEEWRQVLFLG